jgi:5'-3' exonuclease
MSKTVLILDADPLMFRSAYNKNSLDEALSTYNERVEELQQSTFADDMMVACFGKENFRMSFYTDYKNTPGRHESKAKNPYFFELRDHLVSEGRMVPADAMEADDLVRIWSEEQKELGNITVIASVDKDLQCIPGAHYLIHRGELIHVTEEYADVHYWKQILTGDSVDNIRGIKGIGPKKAALVLEGATTSKERKQRVIDKYYEVYGNNWKEEMMHNGTLIHIMRTPTDMFKLSDDDLPVELKKEITS